MNERVAAVLSFVATTIADTETMTTPCTVETTATAPAAKPFLSVPYVILAVVVMGLFGASFAWYHIRHRNSHTARVHTARLHGSRVADSSTCSRPWAITGSEAASASWTRMPKYAKSGDAKKVLVSMYQDDRKHLLGPDGKLRTQRVGDMSTGRRGTNVYTKGTSAGNVLHITYLSRYRINCPIFTSYKWVRILGIKG